MGVVGRRLSPLVSALSGAVVVSLALGLPACSSASGAGSDAGSGSSSSGGSSSGGDASAGDGGSDSASDGNDGGGLGFCISTGQACTPSDVCCAGGTCTPDPEGGPSTCTGCMVQCLPKGAACSSTEDCCNGQANCGEGTVNICL
jgi:hypothetical protein